jgi:hypothetical protein
MNAPDTGAEVRHDAGAGAAGLVDVIDELREAAGYGPW